MPQLSASTLKLFQECPRCFWLHLNKKIERPRGPFPSLPSGIDRVLKGYFETYRRRGILPPLIDGKLEGTLATNALTLGFNDASTHARLWGKLDDCVILPDRRLAPLDHKTRASAPEDVSYSEKYYKFQMDVYTLLLERNGHRTSRTAYLVYYFPVDGKLHEGFPFEVAVHTITTDPDAAYEVFAAACRCLANPLPRSGEACEFCRWADARPPAGAASAQERGAPVPPRTGGGSAAQADALVASPRSTRTRSSPSPRHARPSGPTVSAGQVPDDLFS